MVVVKSSYEMVTVKVQKCSRIYRVKCDNTKYLNNERLTLMKRSLWNIPFSFLVLIQCPLNMFSFPFLFHPITLQISLVNSRPFKITRYMSKVPLFLDLISPSSSKILSYVWSPWNLSLCVLKLFLSFFFTKLAGSSIERYVWVWGHGVLKSSL